MVSSPDPDGVRFVVTAPTIHTGDAVIHEHFCRGSIEAFLACHNGRPGVAVLGFETTAEGGLDAIAASYAAKHPQLLKPSQTGGNVACHSHDNFRILEVFAYYREDPITGSLVPDEGTVIRFVETGGSASVLPGLEPVPADFPPDHQTCKAYSDHWVSNVFDRERFLDTMADTLGFEPKVDFNAGVVAAGEAMIESTVTGNSPAVTLADPDELLTNQQQVYLPTNNALSHAGHVHLFLEQLGQGVQHMASRVPDLIRFIQRANTYRETTGRGLAFLNIPRSYYGRLDADQLSPGALAEFDTDAEAHGIDGAAILKALQQQQLRSTGTELVDLAGIVALDLPSDAELHLTVATLLNSLLKFDYEEDSNEGELSKHPVVAAVVGALKRSRYSNLYDLLRDKLTESEYVAIVRNQILVDIQADDVLYQIFTSPIMQAAGTSDEAPFLEFIQRVCAKQELSPDAVAASSPGCGGFGIRNFLTLFLSIEVSKAGTELAEAKLAGDVAKAARAEQQIEIFTSQLDQSNPVLTLIADAMTNEGRALRAVQAAVAGSTEASQAEADLLHWRTEKERGNKMLQHISDDHKKQMSALRV
eukprot:SAG31_NODE_3800_length_3870_cov_2.092814_2_plen_589_part_00